MMEQKINKENIEINLVFFVSTIEKHLQSNKYQVLIFEIHHMYKNKICLHNIFCFWFNFDFVFFIKPSQNRLCIWTILQERVDFDCNFLGSLPFKHMENIWRNQNLKSTIVTINYQCHLWINSLPHNPDFLLTTLRKTHLENIVGKGENAGNQHFLLFPQCFLPFPKQISIFLTTVGEVWWALHTLAKLGLTLYQTTIFLDWSKLKDLQTT